MDRRLKWKMAIVFAMVNVFVIAFGMFAVVFLGLLKGLVFFFLAMFLSVYIVYNWFVSKHGEDAV